jgi:transposase
MLRFVLREYQWKRLKGLLPGKDSDPGRSAYDNRLFLEAILWKVRVGAPWRDLPDEFGPWNSVFKRFRRWAKKGVFERIFNALSGEPDFEYAMIDGTIIRVHQHGMGAKGGLARASCSASDRAASMSANSVPSSSRIVFAPKAM